MPLQYVSAHGATIPAIGLGTWALRGAECARVVAEAIAAGYRHIDTAASYGNEEAVGAGIRASGIDRAELFLTTKVPESSLAEGACQRSVEASLGRLGLDHVDLILIHWPNRRMSAAEMIKPLVDVKRRGLARHIGLSNFNVALLEEAWQATSEPIVANQCEYHPLSQSGSAHRRLPQGGHGLHCLLPARQGGGFFRAGGRRTSPGSKAGQRRRSCFAGMSSKAASPRSPKPAPRRASGRISTCSASR